MNKLEAQVISVNQANKYANQVYKEAVTAFRPLVGQKILKADGSLLKKYKHLQDNLSLNKDCHIYKLDSIYSLGFTVKTCYNTQGYAFYHDVTAYVGKLHGVYLDEIDETPPDLREDYNAEEIIRLRKILIDAKETVSEIKSALAVFGEY